MSDKPQTAKQHNAELTGESYIVAGVSTQTIASGAVHTACMLREQEQRDKIKAVLRRFVQDEIIIQQAAAEIQKALR